MNSNKINYIKKFGNKQTIISELFKENELNGKDIIDTQTELLRNEIVKSRMLSTYTKTYQQSKDTIDWVAS
tara:strand:+ start:297 stop:509 length:213 start_codon:yes stop_codon:yes gene_type:complete